MAEHKRATTHVDHHVGAQIEKARKLRGISQETLAEGLGITFQQVQKYSHGMNRVSASRLWEIAKKLELPVSYFYEGLAGEESHRPLISNDLANLSLDDIKIVSKLTLNEWRVVKAVIKALKD
jgi:transcriptional regulator with XRE-family HTH domain